MKLKAFSLIICLILVIGCNKSSETKNSEKFSGFTAVGENKEIAKFYIDTNTIKQDINGIVSFNMVRILTDGYVIQNSQTDCKTNFNSSEAVKFRNDGTSQEKFLAETLAIPNQENEINTLVSVACSKAQDNRIITDTFNDAKALELLYGSYQSNTQTALWQNINPPSNLEDYERFLGKSGAVKIYDSKDFIHQEKTKHILLTSTSINDLEEVLLSAFVFIKIGDTWHIEKEYPYLKIAKEGKPKIFHWERIGKEHYGIIEAYSSYLEHEKSKAYIAQYELNEQGLDNFFLYSSDNVLEYAKHIQNLEEVNIIFKESEKPYWDAVLTFNKIGQPEEVYQFKPIIDSSLAENALKELFGATNSSKKIKTAKDELTSIWFEQSFQDGNDNVYAVFTKTQFLDDDGKISDCHQCGIQIGAVIYRQMNGDAEWRILSKQKNIGTTGHWGDALDDKPETLKISVNNILLLVNDSYSIMGESSGWKHLLMFSKNNFKSVGDIIISGDNSGNCGEDTHHKCYKYTGEISVIFSEKEYPDLLVSKKGTEVIYEEDGKEHFFSAKNAIYNFNGKEYGLKNELQEKQAIKQLEQKYPVAQTNQQQTQSDNKKWTRDFGNGIISTIVSEPCQIPEFTNQGYTYSISSSIPIARLKRKDDAWQISGNTATTVLGCWFKDNELIHAKFRRKKDGKIWEQDFNLNDGNWVSE